MGNVVSDPRNGGEFSKNGENGRKSTQDCQNKSKRKQQTPNVANVLAKENKSHQVKKQEVVLKPNKPSSNTDYGPGRPLKPRTEQLVNDETKLHQKSDKVAVQRKPVTGQQEVCKNLLFVSNL
jgi:hypothetical protein